MVSLKDNMRLFQRLDRLFWLLWLGFAISVWIGVKTSLDVSRVAEILKPSQSGCVATLPIPANFSAGGSAIYWTLVAVAQLFLAAMLAVVHQAIRRFAKGHVFVGETLSSFRNLGLLICGWTIYESVFNNAVLFGLSVTGDIQKFVPDYSVDVLPLAVGIFILAFKFIIERAIHLQEDADLTI
jgi:hypothetical protein